MVKRRRRKGGSPKRKQRKRWVIQTESTKAEIGLPYWERAEEEAKIHAEKEEARGERARSEGREAAAKGARDDESEAVQEEERGSKDQEVGEQGDREKVEEGMHAHCVWRIRHRRTKRSMCIPG